MARKKAEKKPKTNMTINPLLVQVVREYIAPPRHNNFTRFVEEALTEKLEKLGIDPYTALPVEIATRRTVKNTVAEAAGKYANSTTSRRGAKKEFRAHLLTDVDWVTHSILGISSCGKLTPSEAQVIGTVQLPAGKYPADAFCLYAEGDSMNKAKLPDGKIGVEPGEVIICRSLDHEAAEVGKVVITLCDGDTCIKRLCEDAEGRYLKPESTNRKHKVIRLPDHARVQAVVIGKV